MTATIAHILPWPAVGGTEHATLRIARAVDRSKYSSIAFCVPDGQPVRKMFADAGFPCATYEPMNPSYRRTLAFGRRSAALAREFKRHHVDLVHCADLLAGHHAALAGRLAGVPVVCHIRNRFDSLTRRERSFLWPIDKFVFVSENTWTHFGCPVSADRGTVVYDGVDAVQADNDWCHRQSVFREFNIPGDAPLVGMMARVAPQKDFPTLARAAARVLQVNPRTRFLIAGDFSSAGTYTHHYLEVRRVLDDCGVSSAFIFTGYRQDVSRLLCALDVFVLSTHWEGLPLVILEAMAHGKPVVATAVDGIPEIVDDGKTGLLFPHEDAARLATHITTLLQNRSSAARLGESGRRLVLSRFSTEQFADSMNALYARVLGSRRAARHVQRQIAGVLGGN
jgi:glycosyltransferase involved in cell wall biosynthesis